jgi:hypothetical protein
MWRCGHVLNTILNTTLTYSFSYWRFAMSSLLAEGNRPYAWGIEGHGSETIHTYSGVAARKLCPSLQVSRHFFYGAVGAGRYRRRVKKIWRPASLAQGASAALLSKRLSRGHAVETGRTLPARERGRNENFRH